MCACVRAYVCVPAHECNFCDCVLLSICVLVTDVKCRWISLSVHSVSLFFGFCAWLHVSVHLHLLGYLSVHVFVSPDIIFSPHQNATKGTRAWTTSCWRIVQGWQLLPATF